MSKVTANFAHPSWLRQREVGPKISVGHSDRFFKSLYSTYYPYHSWDQGGHIRSALHGGILTLEFSPDGSFFVAGCEKHCLLLFDPLSRKKIRCVNHAHSHSVTSVKFVDAQHFATGSDDSTIALWDARNLKRQLRVLEGHTNAVQDIEYSPKDGLLVTSGFDGNVCTWDINSAEEDLCRTVFNPYDLLRMRLTADASKMVVSTANGYLMVVHELALGALERDLRGFQPDACRRHLRELEAARSYALFSRRARNRVEIVTDFPREDDSSGLASLAVHPDGGAALTRGCSEQLGLEWTCVHDVRGLGLPAPDHAPRHRDSDSDDEADRELEAQCLATAAAAAAAAAAGPRTPPGEPPQGEGQEGEEEEEEEEEGDGEESGTDSFDNASEELGVLSDASPRGADRPGSSDGSGSSTEDDELLPVPGRVFLLGATSVWDDEWEPTGAGAGAGAEMGDVERDRTLQSSPGHAPPGEGSSSPVLFAAPPRRPVRSRIFQYTPRLTHFIEERSAGKWYLREVCFSPDGRLMAAPFGCGVRLMAFSPECSELSACVPRTEPLPLHELAINFCHNSIVLCTKFSPRHCLLVSGCFSGDIVWHQPLI